MGIMKRIQGWRDSRLPIPNTLQVLVGLIEPRDPEAYMERKRAARESARERRAIQEERPTTPKIAMVARGSPRVEAAVSEIDLEIDPEQYQVGDDLPSRAAPGWYRFGRTFYRISQGPFQHWGFPEPVRATATIQRSEPSPIPGMRQGLLF
jgi:hypothetical protein